MTWWPGPCLYCGGEVNRHIRPGRKKICIECAIQATADHNRAMAAGTSPHLKHSVAAGYQLAAEIKARKGERYERWVQSITQYMETLETPEDT